MRVTGLIMASDRDSELRELADHRTVAAVPWGGRYRLIDFMLSNMVNSGISHVGLIMRQKYQALIDHVGSGKYWDLSRKNDGIALLPPYSYSRKSSPIVTGEYRGKVDALAGAIDFLQKSRADYVVLTDGNIVANIDLREVIAQHVESENVLTMVCVKKNTCTQFSTYVELNRKKDVQDIRVGDDNDGKCKHVALGIYIMSKQFLIHMITECVTHNAIHFEREFLTRVLEKGKVGSYVFQEYAVRIEDVLGYFQSSMDMLDKTKRDMLFFAERPILTHNKDNAPTYYGSKARVEDSLIADGCHIEGNVKNCILFRNVRIEEGVCLEDCIVLGGGMIQKGASLKHVVLDHQVVIREGRTMMGHDAYPIVVAKSTVI